MFKIDYNESMLVQESNPFLFCKKSKEKLEINTRHVFVGKVQFPNSLPMDFLYREEHGVELLFLVYSTNTSNPNRLIIDCGRMGKITLEEPEEKNTSKVTNEIGYHYDYQYYFQITKDQLRRLCSCTELTISIDDIAKTCYYERECSGFVSVCQMMYREILYRLSFPEADEYINDEKEKIQSTIKQKVEIRNNNK